MSNSFGLVGAYGPFDSTLDEQATAAFAEALEHLVGVDYSPVAVASQVVNGTNYAYFCNAKIVTPDATTYPAMVSVHKPLDGMACITNIQRVAY